MGKKNKNQATPPPSAGQTPLIPPTKEEEHRLHVESVLRTQLRTRVDELDALVGKDLKKTDNLRTILAVGEAIMSYVLQAQGRLRAATGQTDAFVEAKRADFCTRARSSVKMLEGDFIENHIYEEVVEKMKPGLESLQRLVKDLDVPGVKIAIAPMRGSALLDDEGNATQAAAKGAQPEPAQAPEPETPWPAEEPVAAVAPEPQPDPAPAREIPALGMKEQAPVIDVTPEAEPEHHLPQDCTPETAEDMISELFEQLEEAGVEEGLKRKDWAKAYKAWIEIYPENCTMATYHQVADKLAFAVFNRKPISWAVVTDQELFDHQRKLAIAAGE